MDPKAFFLVIAAVIALSSPVFAANLPEIIVDSISPQPVSPGDDLTLKITLNNQK